MNAIVRRLWRRKPLLIIGFSVALSLTILFGVRAAVKYQYWSKHRDEPVAAWMTPGYVSRAWGVDIAVVREALGLPADERDRRTIYRIAIDAGKSPSELVEELETVIRAERESDGATQ